MDWSPRVIGGSSGKTVVRACGLTALGQSGSSAAEEEGELFDWGGTERFTLEFTRPHTSMNANDRWTAAYPGLEYNVRCGVIGGVYPYRYSLNNAPSGMTIDADTGEISWPSPDTDASGISITVVDTKGTEVTSTTWSITVAATRFKFLAPSGSGGNNANAGTLAAPWETLGKAQSSAGNTSIVYMRAGSYTLTDVADGGDGKQFSVSHSDPVIFLGFPGETVTWDYGGDNLDLRGDYKYFDNLRFTNWDVMGMYNNLISDNAVWRRSHFHDYGPGVDGSNSSAIMLVSGAHENGTHDRNIVQDCQFYNQTYGTGNCALKIYSANKMLVEDNVLHDFTSGSEEAIANKAGNAQLTVRGNRSSTMGTGSYGGNQNAAATGSCEAEVCFNYFQDTDGALMINYNDSQNTASYYYRNTIDGGVYTRFLNAASGPFYHDNNVYVNAQSGTPAGSHIDHETIGDISRQVLTNHLAGVAADGIIDANGLLQGGYRTSYLYLRGHEVP